MSEFLLEIGSEELPANFANSARKQLKQIGEKWLKDNNLNFGELLTYSTPRRLVVIVKDLDNKQPDQVKEMRGPATNIAFDAEGNPTKALEGFCRSQNISPDNVEKREVNGKAFVFATVNQEGKKAIGILPSMIDNIFSSLSVTRSMRWGDSNIKFSRPIHWILAIFDGSVLEYNLEEVKADKFTYGHRFLSPEKKEISSVDEYLNALKEKKVIVNNEDRKSIIKSQLEEAAKQANASVLIDKDLLEEVNQLVEQPYSILGKFEEKYLEVPEVVNVTVMKSHQRYFPLFDDNNKLLPNFITISNMNLNPENIRSGNERVLRARLQDAIFFYREDLKHKLDHYLEKLKRVTYFEEIGSVYNKTERLIKISDKLYNSYFSNSNLTHEEVKTAPKLCKADLVTNLVQEFTELQGEIGYYYALKGGETENVAHAIKEQYLPTGDNENLPSKPLSQIVNFSDKLDNLVSCFALGKIPTGSKDPYALRRQCLGIIKTCNEYKIPLNIYKELDYALDVLSEQQNISPDKEDILNKIHDFLSQRLKNELIDRGYRYDIVDSVLDKKANFDNLYALQEKVKSLVNWIENDKPDETVMALARVIRICKQDVDANVDESLFEKEQEKELFNKFNNLKNDLDRNYSENNFDQYLKTLHELVTPINNFFDNVMVMVEDNKIKNNRMALLQKIKEYSDKIGNMDLVILANN